MAGLTDRAARTTPTRATRCAGRTWCCSSATRCTPTRPPRRCRRSSSRGATSSEPPGTELKDYQEYAELYRLAWTDPVEPLAALDRAHRDDLRRPRHPRRLEHLAGVEGRRWRPPTGGTSGSSAGWRRTGSTSTSATSPPTPGPRTRSGRRIHGGGDDRLSETLDAFADRVDQHPETYRWCYARDFGTRPGWSSSTPAPRGCSTPTTARCSTTTEMAWLDEQLRRRGSTTC